MQGRIIKQISNLYTVEIDGKIFECRARGKFRNMGLSPVVGDIVERVVADLERRADYSGIHPDKVTEASVEGVLDELDIG